MQRISHDDARIASFLPSLAVAFSFLGFSFVGSSFLGHIFSGHRFSGHSANCFSANAQEAVHRNVFQVLHEKTYETADGTAAVRILTSDNARLVADPFEIHVFVEVSNRNPVEFAGIDQGKSLGDCVITELNAIGPFPVTSERTEYRWILWVEATRTGTQQVGPFRFKIHTGEESTSEFEVPPQPLLVASVIPKDADPRKIRKIADTVNVPRFQEPSRTVLLAGALAGCGILAFLGFAFRKPTPKQAAKRIKMRLQSYHACAECAGDSEVETASSHAAIVNETKE